MDTTRLLVRLATVEDLSPLVALIESAYRGETSRAGWTTEADLLDGQRTDSTEVVAVLKDPDSRMLAVERSGELVACCHLERRTRPEGGSVAYFGMFAVRPTLQGAGLGGRVLAEAERRAVAEWGVEAMQMQVISARTELIAWYERRGYARTGQTCPFPYGDERFGIPRRPDLAFALLVKPLGQQPAGLRACR